MAFYEGIVRLDDSAYKQIYDEESCNQIDDSWFYDHNQDTLKYFITKCFETYVSLLGST